MPGRTHNNVSVILLAPLSRRHNTLHFAHGFSPFLCTAELHSRNPFSFNTLMTNTPKAAHRSPRMPELLAPAGSFEKLATAIHYGADAVYLGGKEFSLRARAANFDERRAPAGSPLCPRPWGQGLCHGQHFCPQPRPESSGILSLSTAGRRRRRTHCQRSRHPRHGSATCP